MIYILVRRTTDWEDEATFLAQLREDFRPKVDLWNATFTVPFHVFRHRIKAIAQLNLSKISDAVCASWEEIPDGKIVVPTDDDDWFAPELTRVLEQEYDGDSRYYYWNSNFIEVPVHLRHRLGILRRRVLPGWPPRGSWICTTNNYAVVKGADSRLLLNSHVAASKAFEEEKGRVKKISRHLSVMNRTLASQTSLGRPRLSSKREWTTLRKSELIRKYHRYKKVYEEVTDSELSWCRPYLSMMLDLMHELKIKGSTNH